jgi:uncharacterized membrane protein YfcA
MSLTYEFAAGAGVGLAGGISAGLLGVSPGGALVVFSVLMLGAEQHVAQGTSLIAQVPPTGLSGIRRYWDKGNRSPARWIAWLCAGFLLGSVAGGYAAASVSETVLQWVYVVYLAALIALLVLRRGRKEADGTEAAADPTLPWSALLVVGLVAGFSSGFLGIGGGLAITVGLVAGLKVAQHQAQLASLLFSVIPTTMPAAWIYWNKGLAVGFPALIAILVGLWIGTDLGARVANQVGKTVLRKILIGFVSAMTLYMVFKASGGAGHAFFGR